MIPPYEDELDIAQGRIKELEAQLAALEAELADYARTVERLRAQVARQTRQLQSMYSWLMTALQSDIRDELNMFNTDDFHLADVYRECIGSAAALKEP
jgi:predicted  nucleic acid-binding Zn-ribbon protein